MNVTATLFGQFLTFAVLVWFVMKFLWDPMLKMLEDRKARIADGLAAAEAGTEAKQRAEEEVEVALGDAKSQANDIIAQANKRAQEIVAEAKEDARSEGERLVAAAQADVDQQVNQARESLRGEVAELAVSGAQQVLQREVDAKAHASALDRLVAQL